MTDVYDSMGKIEVPEEAYYGASTQRAVENFPISGYTMPASVLRSLALVKLAASRANHELGLIEKGMAEAIGQAAEEVVQGHLADQFPVDVFQTGSGTSTNMNMNEVIAARANELLGSARQGRSPVHPNDHVNLGQSSNDVIPTALHLASRVQAQEVLLPALGTLEAALARKAEEFADVVKLGRTHMQDAVPVTLGQEFSGWAAQAAHGVQAVKRCLPDLEELPLGGTAVGTGLSAHPEFAERAVTFLAAKTGVEFKIAGNRFAAQGGKEALTGFMKALSLYASSLVKIASDLRLLASGPRGGIGEIALPPLQPGSSLMPGKVNPVLVESAIQVGAKVMGNDVAVTAANASGILELNVAMPLIGFAVAESIILLSNTSQLLAERYVSGITADRDRCAALVEKSLALVTPLAGKIGYDRAAELAKQAAESGRTIRELVKEKGILTEEEIEEVLDPKKMV
ncbi:MAG: class II fumarate hydratase [bacterium]|nr:MAG: class II fumarate hydratase [bacterium]